MPSNQPPALRAANRAFHRKEESKMGKKTKPKPEATPESSDQAPVVRRKKSSKAVTAPENTMGKWGLGVLVFVIFGGAFIQILYLLESK